VTDILPRLQFKIFLNLKIFIGLMLTKLQ